MKSQQKLTTKQTLIICSSILLIAGSAGVIGYNFGNGNFVLGKQDSQTLNKADLQTAYSTIQSNFDGDIDQDKLIGGGIRGMVESLGDTNSSYYSPAEYKKLLSQNSGKYFGLGILYSFRNKRLTIADVHPNSPAEKSGILPMSEILAINDTSVATLNNQREVARLFASSETFTLSIQLPNNDRQQFEIRKASYAAPNMVYKKLNSGYGYLRIYQFSPELKKEFAEIAKRITNNKPAKLIIDLRNNPGGENDSEVFLADQFLESGVISEQKFKEKKRDKTFSATGKAAFPDIPIIILVNSQTASAAEVFTVAIQDNKRGIVVGEKTYGKGTIGQFFELPNVSAMKLTIGKWMTPNEKWIQETGIAPNYEVEDEIIDGKDQILQ